MAGKFKASNNLNVNAFNDYINYFIKKNRAGIIQSKNYLIYLLPPMDNLALPYPIKFDEMLALFFKLWILCEWYDKSFYIYFYYIYILLKSTSWTSGFIVR